MLRCPSRVQIGEFFVPPPYIGVGRALRHFAAFLLTLTMIGHLIVRHGQLQLTSGSFVVLSMAPCLWIMRRQCNSVSTALMLFLIRLRRTIPCPKRSGVYGVVSSEA